MQAAPVTLELKFDVHVCGCADCSFGKGHVHFTESIGQGSKSVEVCNTGSYLSIVWHAARLGRAVGGEVC